MPAKIPIEVVAMVQQAVSDLNKVKNTIGSMDEESTGALNLKDALLGVGAAMTSAAVVAGVMKSALDFGREGAAVAQTGESFAFLSKQLGISTTYLDTLRQASRGTVDDMTLMSSTLVLVSGLSDQAAQAFMNAAPALMEIAKAANKINPSLGTTAKLYEDISIGIKRSSPRILDNLGIIVKIGEANQKWADAMGVSVESMTAEEKMMALLNETLRVGDQMMKQAGGSADSMTDSFDKVNASLKNSENAFKSWLSPFLMDYATGVDNIVSGGNRIKDAFDEHQRVMLAAAGSYEEFRTEMERARSVMPLTLQNIEIMTIEQYNGAKADRWRAWAVENFARVLREQAVRDLVATRQAAIDAGGGMDEFASTVGASSLAIDEWWGQFADIAKAADELINKSLEPLTSEFLNQQIAATLTGEALLTFMVSTGKLSLNTYAALTDLKNLTAEFDTNKNGVIDAYEAVDEYWVKLRKLQGLNITNSVTTTYFSNYEDDNNPKPKEVPHVNPTPPGEQPGSENAEDVNPNGGGIIINANITTEMDYARMLVRLKRDLARTR
jgi:hypothetical protein